MMWRAIYFLLLLVFSSACSAQASAASSMKKASVQLGSSAAFASDGTLFAALREGPHVVVLRSQDKGRTWSPPLQVNAQPEAIAADGENRPKLAFAADGGVLVSWTRPLSKPYTGEIRLARLEPGALRFSPPITVHQDRSEITHRFETLITAGDGRVYVAWIDKRDLAAYQASASAYRGAAIYAAVSEDGGRSFKPEVKVADHSCECCRLAVARDVDGAPVLLWRHVFAPNERDHALVKLQTDGRALRLERATFDRWQIDACPHHGPALAIAADGQRHAVWFNQRQGEGRVWYGRLPNSGGDVDAVAGVLGQRAVGDEQASHADLAVSGQQLVITWKAFDGEQVRLYAEVSKDGGQSFAPAKMLAATHGASDQARIVQGGEDLFVFWHTEQEGLRLFAVSEWP